ncbi:hypothetical protein HBI22_220910 [Parastagonospora nodorum]|nr:hypothetical protein HBI22_220910 [Parastagonospora nodorum]
MFKWYKDSARCYVSLQDVSLQALEANLTGYGWRSVFRRSRWFTRGWTLQEILAPTSVNFFTYEGAPLGDKHSLWEDISEATQISSDVLHGNVYTMYQVPVDIRLGWAKSRQTTREEEKFYSLLGLFNVHMSLLYGEGLTKAFRRFHEELKKNREDPTELNAILAQVTAQRIEDNVDKIIMQNLEMDLMPLKRSATIAFQGTDHDGFSKKPRQPLPSEKETSTQSTDGIPKRLSDIQDMQNCWDEATARNGYSRVAVLLVKWADEIGELNTRADVSDAVQD